MLPRLCAGVGAARGPDDDSPWRMERGARGAAGARAAAAAAVPAMNFGGAGRVAAGRGPGSPHLETLRSHRSSDSRGSQASDGGGLTYEAWSRARRVRRPDSTPGAAGGAVPLAGPGGGGCAAALSMAPLLAPVTDSASTARTSRGDMVDAPGGGGGGGGGDARVSRRAAGGPGGGRQLVGAGSMTWSDWGASGPLSERSRGSDDSDGPRTADGKTPEAAPGDGVRGGAGGSAGRGSRHPGGCGCGVLGEGASVLVAAVGGVSEAWSRRTLVLGRGVEYEHPASLGTGARRATARGLDTARVHPGCVRGAAPGASSSGASSRRRSIGDDAVGDLVPTPRAARWGAGADAAGAPTEAACAADLSASPGGGGGGGARGRRGSVGGLVGIQEVDEARAMLDAGSAVTPVVLEAAAPRGSLQPGRVRRK